MVDLPLDTWIQAGLVFIAVALGAVSLALAVEWLQERSRQRKVLEQLRSYDPGLAEGPAGGLFRGATPGASQWLEQLAVRTPAVADFQRMLHQSGVSWTMERFLFISVGLSLVFGVCGLLITRIWPMALFLAGLGALLPAIILRQKRARWLNAFEAGLPEAIDLLGRAIRAGHPLSSGLQMVADETHEPISSEFRRTFEEQRFGLPFDDAMSAMADRVTLVDVRMLVTAVLIQRVVGGNLAEVLDNLAQVIRARFVVRRQLRTYTAQGRISGYVLAVLPLAVGTIIYMLNRSYVELLFTSMLGRFMLGSAIVMQLIGYLWIRKIVNIEI